ncbi:hypothetical protein A0H81_13339 [Grifola frondosa]|uniref:Uncharacterized protein n=1 Tax=Grifola frondosa TaxID=5627 RepID=A0A1C7LQK0_GRIFR|nr:hypothetical protein A0H81_13339 [Grifola frondosa]
MMSNDMQGLTGRYSHLLVGTSQPSRHPPTSLKQDYALAGPLACINAVVEQVQRRKIRRRSSIDRHELKMPLKSPTKFLLRSVGVVKHS